MGKAEGERSRAGAEAHDLSGRPEENCSRAESTVGEGKERSLKGTGGGDLKLIGSAGGGFTPLSQRPRDSFRGETLLVEHDVE
jgi:hypothetical protein